MAFRKEAKGLQAFQNSVSHPQNLPNTLNKGDSTAVTGIPYGLIFACQVKEKRASEPQSTVALL